MPQLIIQLDTALFFFLNQGCRNTVFDIVMPFITSRTPLIVLPFLAFLLVKERKKALIILAVSLFSLLCSDALSNVVKYAVGRQRPCNVLEGVHLLAGCTGSFSMPSSHASNSFAFAVPFLVMTQRRLRYFFVFLALIVSFSRVYIGVHYPGDVIAGALEGTFSAVAVITLYRWAEKRFRDRLSAVFLWVFLLVISLFRLYYLSFGPIELSGDEAHYWEWSRRLDLSYYSKGPMIAYLIAVSTSLFGNTLFGVRVFAVLLSLLSSIILYRLGKEMYGERVGAISAVLFQVIPLFSAFGVIFTIDSPFTFFWILSLYLFWKAISSLPIQPFPTAGECGFEKPRQGGARHASLVNWILLGISVGAGLLAKYTMVFFYVSMLCFLFSSSSRRKMLRNTRPYMAMVISAILFLPVIVWNAQHDWVTIRHTAGQAHIADGFQVSLRSLIEFIGSQLGLLTPVFCVLMLVALWKIRGKYFETPGGNGIFLFWFSAPIVIFFLVKSLQGKVQPNWAMTGYITGIIAFSKVFLDGWKKKGPFLRATIILGISLSVTLTVVAHYPSKFHLPQKLDPSSRLRGWSDLGRQIQEVYEEMRGKGNIFIFSDSYQIASELAFFMKNHPVTYCVNLGRRMNQYDLWPGLENLVHSNGIFVTIGDAALDSRIREAFQSCEKHVLKVHDRGTVLRENSVFLCYDFRGMTKEKPRTY